MNKLKKFYYLVGASLGLTVMTTIFSMYDVTILLAVWCGIAAFGCGMGGVIVLVDSNE